MAILSKSNKNSGPSSGHDYAKLHDTIFGHRTNRLNKRSEVFTNDYIYSYSEDNDEELLDEKEVGINKLYSYFSEESNNDDCKHANVKKDRRDRYRDLDFEDFMRRIRSRG